MARLPLQHHNLASPIFSFASPAPEAVAAAAQSLTDTASSSPPNQSVFTASTTQMARFAVVAAIVALLAVGAYAQQAPSAAPTLAPRMAPLPPPPARSPAPVATPPTAPAPVAMPPTAAAPSPLASPPSPSADVPASAPAAVTPSAGSAPIGAPTTAPTDNSAAGFSSAAVSFVAVAGAVAAAIVF